MTVTEDIMQTVFELLHGEATDFQCKEVTNLVPTVPAPVSGYTNGSGHHARAAATFPTIRPTSEQRAAWAMKHWAGFEAVLRASPDQTAVYNDVRFGQVLEQAGVAKENVSPLWTVYMRAGKVDRIARGLYKLVQS
jgi:hypothetical protein